MLYDNHFMTYVSQVIKWYILNLYSAECQLYNNLKKSYKQIDAIC